MFDCGVNSGAMLAPVIQTAIVQMNDSKKKLKLLFVVNDEWGFYGYRLPVARAALREGFEVAIAARGEQYREEIIKEGFKLIPIRLSRRLGNPFSEIASIQELVLLYRSERPDIVHHVALKPVLYGSIAAAFARVPIVVNALTGMGYVFTSSSTRAHLLRLVTSKALRLLLNRPRTRVIVQNADDRKLLTQGKLVNPGQIVLIRGSGVDLQLFPAGSESTETPIVLYVGRMLWHKGVGEFVEAARILKEQSSPVRFILVGESDSDNPTAVPIVQLEEWHKSGIIEWWGRRQDMPRVFAQSHIVCLPSYGEGLPKSLLEAAASGRPIVATDVPGCREVVRDGENGFLVPVRNAQKLADAIKRLIVDPALRTRMGLRGREIASAEFSVEQICRETVWLYRELLQCKGLPCSADEIASEKLQQSR